MNIEEALNYINARSWSQWRLGLSRTIELLERVGNPQKDLRFVHVAGTNGKGSACAMIESVLRAAGYRTGMYPSPFIEKFNERIQVSGEQISDEDLCELTEIVKAAGDAMEDHPTHFEIITAIGMLYFRRMKCDIVVLEVGLGGTYDSTNIIDAPEVAVITNIGFDHTEYLGDTLAEIAGNKAGIIKSGSDVVAYPNVKEVTDVIEAACREKGCRLDYAAFGRAEPLSSDLSGQSFRWKTCGGSAPQAYCGNSITPQDPIPAQSEEACTGRPTSDFAEHGSGCADETAAEPADYLTLCLPLLGEYQLRNAAVALTAVEALRRRGWSISDGAIIEGMANVKWPARFELLGTDPIFILDGGHNRQCAEAVAESIEKYLPGGGLTLLIGMLADKDYESAVEALLPYASKCICTAPDSERALPADELAETIKRKAAEVRQAPGACADPLSIEIIPNAAEAVAKAACGEDTVLAFGSLYLAGEVRTAYRKLTVN